MNRHDFSSSPIPRPVQSGEPEGGEDGLMALVRLVVGLISRHKKKLALWIAVVTGFTAIYVHSLPFYYTASTTILLTPRQATTDANGGTSTAPAILDISAAESEIELMRSERVLATAFNALIASPADFGDQAALTELVGGPLPKTADTSSPSWQSAFARFEDRLDLRRVGQSYALDLSYTANDPVLAARIANSVASAYLLQSLEAKAIQAATNSGLITRLEALQNQVDAARLATQKGMAPATATPSADAQIIGIARPPLAPSGPRKKLMIAFAAVLAALSGTLVLALSHGFSARIRTPADLARTTRLPCLVVVPRSPRTSRPREGKETGSAVVMEALDSPFAVAIRDLRTAITATLPPPQRGTGRCIAFVAWDRQAGCSFITQNLASVARKGGRPSVVIETDFRSAGASRPEGSGRPAGSSLADILYNRIPFEAIRYQEIDGVSFLPAASQDASVNYFADLGSTEMVRLMDGAAAKADVYLDLPPLRETRDAAVMAQRVDAVVIVVREGKTRTDELDRAARTLGSVGANVIGVVLNRV